jgi:hypothetical protein
MVSHAPAGPVRTSLCAEDCSFPAAHSDNSNRDCLTKLNTPLRRAERNMPLPPPGTVLTDLERQRIEAAIRDTCSASLMSDTKWRKLVAVVETVPSIQHYFVKFLRSPVEREGSGFLSVHAPHEFIDTFSFGPIFLREIEWLEFPHLVPRRVGKTPVETHRQDLTTLREKLEAIGKFPLVETARGLRIVGHVRNPDLE